MSKGLLMGTIDKIRARKARIEAVAGAPSKSMPAKGAKKVINKNKKGIAITTTPAKAAAQKASIRARIDKKIKRARKSKTGGLRGRM